MKFSKLFTAIAATAFMTVASSAYAAGSVATEGSTSMEHLIGAIGESFTNQNPDIRFTFNPTGSGAGIQAAAEGRCDIGLSSRALKGDETKTLNGETVALDGIVLVVNPANPVSDLSLEQIKKLFSGEVKSWKELGGADNPVVLIGREAGSGTRDGFESVTGTKDVCKYRQELTSTGDVIATVSKNPNAIGYASLSAVSDKIKPLTVGGVHADVNTVQDGSYKLQRPFILVTKKDAKQSDAVKSFLNYALSKDVDQIVSDTGAVPVKR
ncbi:phosphate ABC transporter substrate-binding protein [Anaerobiospirillum succiniciproducens]|uniref:phosphate ABC transporter substrate-binding protein n=1 Tax=Anaerobiospirillum succiniciproducens TaxID=13335 RepID=UPI000421E5E2|nr:phosphate ABC transporter substrate-binding protein [Anaerobiospirillum succiniciproducens]